MRFQPVTLLLLQHASSIYRYYFATTVQILLGILSIQNLLNLNNWLKSIWWNYDKFCSCNSFWLEKNEINAMENCILFKLSLSLCFIFFSFLFAFKQSIKKRFFTISVRRNMPFRNIFHKPRVELFVPLLIFSKMMINIKKKIFFGLITFRHFQRTYFCSKV